MASSCCGGVRRFRVPALYPGWVFYFTYRRTGIKLWRLGTYQHYSKFWISHWTGGVDHGDAWGLGREDGFEDIMPMIQADLDVGRTVFVQPGFGEEMVAIDSVKQEKPRVFMTRLRTASGARVTPRPPAYVRK